MLFLASFPMFGDYTLRRRFMRMRRCDVLRADSEIGRRVLDEGPFLMLGQV